MLAPGLATGVFAVVAEPTKNSGSSVSGYVLPIIILLLVVFFIVNSRRRHKTLARQRQEEQAQWTPGTEIVTRAGLIATIVERHDDHVVLEVAPGVRARYVHEAIGKIWYEEPAAPQEPAEPEAPDLPLPDAHPSVTDNRLAD